MNYPELLMRAEDSMVESAGGAVTAEKAAAGLIVRPSGLAQYEAAAQNVQQLLAEIHADLDFATQIRGTG